MNPQDLAQRQYEVKKHKILRDLIEYYSAHIEEMGIHWPKVRERHEQWMRENLGSKDTDYIINHVRGWNGQA